MGPLAPQEIDDLFRRVGQQNPGLPSGSNLFDVARVTGWSTKMLEDVLLALRADRASGAETQEVPMEVPPEIVQDAGTFVDVDHPCPFCGGTVFYAGRISGYREFQAQFTASEVAAYRQGREAGVYARLCGDCHHIDLFAPYFQGA